MIKPMLCYRIIGVNDVLVYTPDYERHFSKMSKAQLQQVFKVRRYAVLFTFSVCFFRHGMIIMLVGVGVKACARII